MFGAMRKRTDCRAHRGVRGFTILEIAISLALLAVLAIGIMVPLVSQLQQRNVATTEKTLNDIKDALLGFAAVNGRLPCPATAAGVPSGAETFAAGGSEANGQCASFWGFVPARTLGITPVDSSGFALDGWNNRIRYAVAKYQLGTPTVPAIPTFTSMDGLRNATLPEVAKATSLLNVCDSGNGVTADVSCGSATTLTATAAAVIWSSGPNAKTGGGTGMDEKENESTNDRIFVSRTASDLPTNNPFDDVVTWLGINTLVNRMVGAGQLP